MFILVSSFWSPSAYFDVTCTCTTRSRSKPEPYKLGFSIWQKFTYFGSSAISQKHKHSDRWSGIALKKNFFFFTDFYFWQLASWESATLLHMPRARARLTFWMRAGWCEIRIQFLDIFFSMSEHVGFTSGLFLRNIKKKENCWRMGAKGLSPPNAQMGEKKIPFNQNPIRFSTRSNEFQVHWNEIFRCRS